MAFKTFAPGVLTSSDVNTFLMRQAVITCTSSTRPASPSEGMFIYETDTDSLVKYDGSNWVYQGYWESWTPSLSGTGWDIGNGTITGQYARIGDVVHGRLTIIFGSTSTFGAAPLDVSSPVSRTGNGFGDTLGGGYAADASASAGYVLTLTHSTADLMRFRPETTPSTFAQYSTVTSTQPFTWNGSDGDLIRATFTYRAA